MKIASIHYNDNYWSAFNHETVYIQNRKDFIKILDCKLAVFWGGEDITPEFYNEKPVYTHAGWHTNHRDFLEKSAWEFCTKNKIPMLGICRGAQLLCALNGGKLWQDVSNHTGGRHEVKLFDGRIIIVNSIHHQMMRPTKDMQILGRSFNHKSKYYLSETDQIHFHDTFQYEQVIEPEFVLFNNLSLGVQGHPEYSGTSSDITNTTRELVNTFLKVPL